MKKITRAATALAAVAATGALGFGIASATPAAPLPVTLSADGNGTAAASASGVTLTLGSTGTYAQVSVDLKALGSDLAPATPPSFTTDLYAAGSPRWVIELASGNYLFGYPAQLGAAANAGFTGAQWTANGGNGKSLDTAGAYETYQQALTDAGDILGNVKVTSAYIVEDAGQAPGTQDVLTGVQYAGDTAPYAYTPPAAVPYVDHGRVLTNSGGGKATVGWSSSARGWPSDNHCVEVYMYGFDTPKGTAHVGFTCDHGNRAADIGYMWGLSRDHSVSLFIQPATGTYGHHEPIPGTDATAHVYVIAA